jgi:cobyrinic acid a,c-diamide synthase
MGEYVNPDLISKLVNIGKGIHAGHPINDKELDELVRVIYLSGQEP